MKNRIASIEQRKLITKEFAAALAGKQPHPYLRLHDPVLKTIVERENGPYAERMIHFWREVSLAGMEVGGRGMDECYALLLESAFDLALAEPEWATEVLADGDQSNQQFGNLKALNHQLSHPITHQALIDAFKRIYAPLREQDSKWQNSLYVAFISDIWFWAAIRAAVGIDEKHPAWCFCRGLITAAANGWADNHRMYARLIREAPHRASATPRDQLMAHPLLRIARLKYRDDSVEQKLVLRFLNSRCIKEGFGSEEDHFLSDLTLAQWVRDARFWAEQVLENDPRSCVAMFEAAEYPLEDTRDLFRREVGVEPAEVDDMDAASALMKWAKRQRGFEYSQYRAQLWEFVVVMVDAALWLGWTFPRRTKSLQCSGNDDE
jgi:hypothetical protein